MEGSIDVLCTVWKRSQLVCAELDIGRIQLWRRGGGTCSGRSSRHQRRFQLQRLRPDTKLQLHGRWRRWRSCEPGGAGAWRTTHVPIQVSLCTAIQRQLYFWPSCWHRPPHFKGFHQVTRYFCSGGLRQTGWFRVILRRTDQRPGVCCSGNR